MSPLGVMTREQASYSPGLSSVESQKFCPGTQTRSRDELPSLSLGISKTLPLSSVLVDQPATEPLLQIGSKKPRNRAAPREPISNFITSYSSMAGDPKEAHDMPVRDKTYLRLSFDSPLYFNPSVHKSCIPVRQRHAHNNECYVKMMVF